MSGDGEALAYVRKLQSAGRSPVRHWPGFGHLIPESSGVYRFTDADGRRVYVGEAKNLRRRLAEQVMSYRIGKPWTPDNPPSPNICEARNLLINVARHQRDGEHLYDKNGKIDPGDPEHVEALNRAFAYIDGLSVQWVRCPAKLRKRVEYLAGRCVLDPRCGGAS